MGGYDSPPGGSLLFVDIRNWRSFFISPQPQGEATPPGLGLAGESWEGRCTAPQTNSYFVLLMGSNMSSPDVLCYYF